MWLIEITTAIGTGIEIETAIEAATKIIEFIGTTTVTATTADSVKGITTADTTAATITTRGAGTAGTGLTGMAASGFTKNRR